MVIIDYKFNVLNLVRKPRLNNANSMEFINPKYLHCSILQTAVFSVFFLFVCLFVCFLSSAPVFMSTTTTISLSSICIGCPVGMVRLSVSSIGVPDLEIEGSDCKNLDSG